LGNRLFLPVTISTGVSGPIHCVEDLGETYSVLWQKEINYWSNTAAQPLIANGNVYINGGNSPYGQYTLLAFDVDTGATTWIWEFSDFTPTSPTTANNLLYYAMSSSIYCFGKPLNLSLDTSRSQAGRGDSMTYTLTINSYNGPSTGVTLVETLPNGVQYVSSSDSGVLNGRMVVWDGLGITGDAIKTVTVSVAISSTLLVGTHDLVSSAVLDYPGSPEDLTECFSERVHTLVQVWPPWPPGKLSATGHTDRISLSWIPSVAGAEAASGYRVYRATYPGLVAGPGTLLTDVYGPLRTGYDDFGVTKGLTCCYIVRGVDVLGNEGEASNEACGSLTEPIVPPSYYTGPVRVFPNPFDPAKAVRGTVKFEGVPPLSRIRLYTTRSLRVRELVQGGSWAVVEWDGRNEDGKRVAPGVYVWIVEAPGGKRQDGRVVVR
jgi:uncharacterized repeat protein (TIGR01451 family)